MIVGARGCPSSVRNGSCWNAVLHTQHGGFENNEGPVSCVAVTRRNDRMVPFHSAFCMPIMVLSPWFFSSRCPQPHEAAQIAPVQQQYTILDRSLLAALYKSAASALMVALSPCCAATESPGKSFLKRITQVASKNTLMDRSGQGRILASPCFAIKGNKKVRRSFIQSCQLQFRN